MLSTYNPNAVKEYVETESTYFEECGQHYAQGRAHAEHNGPANLGRLYYFYNMRLKNLLYLQFREAVDFKKYEAIQKILPPAANAHVTTLRHLMASDVVRTASGFLPTMPKTHDPFSPSHYEIKAQRIDLSLGDFHSTSALAIIASNPDKAAVCFTHRPGFTGMSPTNAAENLVQYARESFLSNYQPGQLRFFTHAPPEAGDEREHMFEVSVGSDKLFRSMSHKPQFFDFALFNALALPEMIETEAKDITDSDEEVDWHRMAELKQRHSAQIHRRYLLAL